MERKLTAILSADVRGYSRLMGENEEAIAPLKKTLTLNPNLPYAHFNLAFIYSKLGREEKAWAEAAEILRLVPQFSLEVHGQRTPYTDPAELECFLNGLRKAGLE